MRLYIAFCTFYSILLLEIVYGLLRLFGRYKYSLYFFMAERIRFLSAIIIRLSAIETIRPSVKIYIAFRASPKCVPVSVVNFFNGISTLGTKVNALVIMSIPSLLLNSWRYRSISQDIALSLPLILFIITASKTSRTYIPSIRALFCIS